MSLSIDPASWSVTILPAPPRPYMLSEGLGLCQGVPFGHASTTRLGNAPFWWPGGQPRSLEWPRRLLLNVASGSGDAIVGHWYNAKTGAQGAACWRPRSDGGLEARDLHDSRFESSGAMAARNGLIVGGASHKGKLGRTPPRCGLVWLQDGEVVVLQEAFEVELCATDGERLAGSFDGRAAWWPGPHDRVRDLQDPGTIHALQGDWAGGVGWKGLASRAVTWNLATGERTDLTPRGFKRGGILDMDGPWQAGWVARREKNSQGITCSWTQAALWCGSAKSFVDLDALLPSEEFNASRASAVQVFGSELMVVGTAAAILPDDPRMRSRIARSGFFMAVVWRARLR